MNRVVLLGRLTRDVETRYTQDGKAVSRFNVACDRRFKREGQPEADFISCVAFGKTAEFLEKYFIKGKLIVLDGEIMTGSYEKDGKKVYTTEVLVSNVEFVGSKSESGGGQKQDGNIPAGFAELTDDDMPF